MSNCISLKNQDKPIGVVPFRQDIWDRLEAWNPTKNPWDTPREDPLRWVDVFCCDTGRYARGSKPDRILFYIAFTTHREMRWFRREIKAAGGWLMDFRYTDECDGHRAVYTWRYHEED